MGGDCCLQHPTMQLNITDHLADALKEALNRAGLPVPESVFWEGPLVIVNARAAAVGDALARILRSLGSTIESQYYVNDAGNQVLTLARSVEVRLRQEMGEPVELPPECYQGEYLIDLARDWLARDPAGVRALLALPERERLERLGRRAVEEFVTAQRRVLDAYGTVFDRWVHEAADVRAAGLPERAIEALAAAGHTYEQD